MQWREPIPDSFWGPEHLNSAAFRELVDLIDARAEVAAILGALSDVGDVVDVGGGTGFLSQRLGVPVTVVEPSAEQRTQVPVGIAVLEGRAEALPLGDRSTDAVIATWVLQYCDDPLRAIDEFARVARHRVVIVQAAPNNDLVDIYNIEAGVAGLPRAHHGYLLAHAAARLHAAGFTIMHDEIAIPVRVFEPRAMAELLSRLHFAKHPKRMEMIEATAPIIADLVAARGRLADDGAILVARR